MTPRRAASLAAGWVVCFLVGAGVASPQTPPPTQTRPPTGHDTPLRVFLDCQDFSCDLNFLRTEIDFVDHVRDRRDADVHILVTGEQTASGGREATVTFLGQREFAGRDDSLRYVTRQTDTDDEVRRGLEQTLKLGLVRYLADTSTGRQLEIGLPERLERLTVVPQSVDDPWKLWVFRLRFNGSFSGERSSSDRSVSGVVSANRTTGNWRIDFASNASYREDRFLLSEESTFTAVTRSTLVSGRVVKSLHDHWSAAVLGDISSSTFLNQSLTTHAAAGFEYNVFPYRESTRRMFTFQYTVGLNSFDYEEETIFDRLSERRVDQTLLVSLDVTQPWGQAGASIEAANYLDDSSQSRLEFEGELEVRISRGVALNLKGAASRIRDQIYLAKGEATPEEILSRQHELATSYRFSLSFGISYTFGSIFNNVVNPRFGG